VYLKSLEIQGFKSFPDKTVLQFGSDITAIVGPNGSGKSNISDAISWVMGEQSSKALRGAKMEDVIFGGTLKRAPVGFAEATLVLDNSDGSLSIETPEVMITRRYYRSGESEYYINRESARLRDINELLMDTGLGREGYSNIGQGKVDEILSVKSTDRREVFEEAAGISKYRHRKEETERRLEATEENLLRIGDKISELELQVEPLREQAEKAKKYLVLREELCGLEVTVWLDALGKVGEAAKKAEQDYASAAFILEQAHDELNRLYSQSEQLSLRLNQQTLELDRRRDEIYAMEQEHQKRETELSVLEAGIANKQQNIERVRREMDEQASRSGGVAGQIAAQKKRMEELDAELSSLESSLKASESEEKRLSDRGRGAGQGSDVGGRRPRAAAGPAVGKEGGHRLARRLDGRGAAAPQGSAARPRRRRKAAERNRGTEKDLRRPPARGAGGRRVRQKHDRGLRAAPQGADGEARQPAKGSEQLRRRT
jgi:chromosome segregation protein